MSDVDSFLWFRQKKTFSAVEINNFIITILTTNLGK